MLLIDNPDRETYPGNAMPTKNITAARYQIMRFSNTYRTAARRLHTLSFSTQRHCLANTSLIIAQLNEALSETATRLATMRELGFQSSSSKTPAAFANTPEAREMRALRAERELTGIELRRQRDAETHPMLLTLPQWSDSLERRLADIDKRLETLGRRRDRRMRQFAKQQRELRAAS